MEGQSQPQAPEKGCLSVQLGALVGRVPELFAEGIAHFLPDPAQVPFPEGIAVREIPGVPVQPGSEFIQGKE